MGSTVLVTGGARSGKSTYAEFLASHRSAPVVYLATMPAGMDPESDGRIAQHRERRPAEWSTVEEPLDIAAALTSAPDEATVLLDCLTLWVSNLLYRECPDVDSVDAAGWRRAVDVCVSGAGELVKAQRARPGALIAVTNEVGMGIVPGDALTRAFRDAAGLVNQRFAEAAAKVVLMVSGRPLEL